MFQKAERAQKPKQKISLNIDEETVEIYYSNDWDQYLTVKKVQQELEKLQKNTIDHQKKVDEKTAKYGSTIDNV